MGIDFGHFALELGMVFEGITCTGVYERVFSFQFQSVRKKERYANSKWHLRNLFCCCSNLSNDDIIT